MISALLLALVCSVSATEVPSYLRETAGQKDVGGINENFRSLADTARKIDLTNGGSVDGTLTVKSIAFPDGTSQTTAASGTTFGPTAYSNAMDYSNVVHGVWSVVAYSSFTAAASVVYTNFNSSYTFRANMRAVQNTSVGLIAYLPQGDTGATHQSYAYALDSVANNYTTQFNTGAACWMAGAANVGGYIKVGTGMKASLEIGAVPGNTKIVDSYVRATFQDDQNAAMNFSANCRYTGTTDFSSVTVNTSAGTMTGYITWEALWTPQVQ